MPDTEKNNKAGKGTGEVRGVGLDEGLALLPGCHNKEWQRKVTHQGSTLGLKAPAKLIDFGGKPHRVTSKIHFQ